MKFIVRSGRGPREVLQEEDARNYDEIFVDTSTDKVRVHQGPPEDRSGHRLTTLPGGTVPSGDSGNRGHL